MTVGPLIDPASVAVELLLVGVELLGQISLVASAGQERIAGTAPIVELVAAVIEIVRIAEETSVGGGHGFEAADHHGPALGGRFQAPFMDERLGHPGGVDVEPVEPRFEDIEGGVGGVDFDALILDKGADPQVSPPLENVDLDVLLALLGQDGELKARVLVEAKVVATAEMDLGPAPLGSHLVSLDEGQVDLAFFVAQVGGPLDVNVAVDVAEPGEAVGIEGLFLAGQPERNGNDECR